MEKPKLFESILNRVPSKREQDEIRIEVELGKEYLDFAKKFEEDFVRDSKAVEEVNRSSDYPENMTLREKIWYRACLNTYRNFFLDKLKNEKISLNFPKEKKEKMLRPDYLKIFIKYLKFMREFLTEEEYSNFKTKLTSTTQEIMDENKESGSIENIIFEIRNEIYLLFGEVGMKRYLDGALPVKE